MDWLYNGYEFGFFLPKDTPKDIQDTFDTAVAELMEDEEVQQAILDLGNEPTYLSPADYESQLADIQTEYEDLWAAANAAA